MPAAGPIPPEVTDCFTKAGDYGRFLIASGPYMIEGSDQLDITSCDTMKAISGFNPEKFLNLVRNPNYDPATDSPEVRSNYPDRFEYTDQLERGRHLRAGEGRDHRRGARG